jgi:predicted amidohydrolase
MRVGFFQFDIVFGNIAANLNKVADALRRHEFDLIVLPELFTTGYLFSSKQEAKSYAEPIPDGRTTQTLMKIARDRRAYIVGGMVEVDGDGVYNTAVVVGPDGYVGKHRKWHLSKFEIPLFDRGHELNVFNLNGVRVGVLLCFDTWFPEAARRLMLQGAQIICSPANFGGPWSLDIIKARAIENIVFTITANRTGEEHRNGIDAEFRGESQIVSCAGDVLARADHQESFSFVEIDPEQARKKSTVMCDNLIHEIQLYGNSLP